jgi:hypothetical protein
MSTLVAQTISNGTVSTSSANVIRGSAKAWVNWNPSSGSVVINASYNVSSVTRNGAGDYTINYTNAFVDISYVFSGSSGVSSGSQTTWMTGAPAPALTTWKQTTSTNIWLSYANNAQATVNPSDVSFIAIR